MSDDYLQGDALIDSLSRLFERIRRYEFPALSVEEVTDDGETFTALRCPRCECIVYADDLVAVDFAERWTTAHDVDSDEAIDRREIGLYSDDRGDFDETLYYKHDGHAVRLPEGWREAWS